MEYRFDARSGNKLSVMGMGCMRLPRGVGGIDVLKTELCVLTAIEQGVNYFDTAYAYGGSEAALGEIVERNGLRDRIFIASKLPHGKCKSIDDVERLFATTLERLRTDYLDYYLMHNIVTADQWTRLVELGIEDWIARKKESGAIRRIGFSFHGGMAEFRAVMDAYDWDFVQIQYNYVNEHYQAGREGMELAASRGLPVIVMEPLLGGRLTANLPKEATSALEDAVPGRTPAAWGLRWLFDQPEVTVVLSGMNSEQMVRENAASAGNALPGCMDERDQEFLQKVLASINEKMKVGCTGCRYCMPCPHGVDIPGTFSAYNRKYTDSSMSALREYVMCTLMRKDSTSASHCVGCGKCEKHCPQHIPIRKELANARRALEGPVYKVASKVVPIVIKY